MHQPQLGATNKSKTKQAKKKIPRRVQSTSFAVKK